MTNYDVIIIGAGLAGLSLGSELSKKHNVLIIEKDQIKKEHKTWTSEEAIIKEAGLEKFISARFGKCYFRFLDKEKNYLIDKFATVDDVAILSFFEKIVKDNQSNVMENCSFLDIFKTDKNCITIKTTRGMFSTCLLIDCSGMNSKLTTKYQIYNKNFYYPTYGGVYDISLVDKEVCLLEIMTNDFPINWFETFPANKNQTIVYTFQSIDKNTDPKNLKKIHEKQIKNCYLKDELKGKKMVREVFGTIPMGEVKKNAVDNIFFFGDTDLIASPFAGSGFTNIIKHYKSIASHLSKNLIDSTLKEKELNYHFDKNEQMNRDIQTIIGLILINSKPEQVEIFFDVLKTIPNKIIVNMVFLRLNVEEVAIFTKTIVKKFGFKKLADILPKKEYMFIAKEIFKAAEDIVIEDVIEDIYNIRHQKVLNNFFI
ncbi:MAG: lycopene cyclase family protein [Patescibacteria group bacterium]